MSAILDFLTSPLSLPISPIWEIVIFFIIGEIAYLVAFSFAGKHAIIPGDRKLLHWLIRIPLYFILWLVACIGILAIRFIKTHLLLTLIIVGALIATVIVALIMHHNKLEIEKLSE